MQQGGFHRCYFTSVTCHNSDSNQTEEIHIVSNFKVNCEINFLLLFKIVLKILHLWYIRSHILDFYLFNYHLIQKYYRSSFCPADSVTIILSLFKRSFYKVKYRIMQPTFNIANSCFFNCANDSYSCSECTNKVIFQVRNDRENVNFSYFQYY